MEPQDNTIQHRISYEIHDDALNVIATGVGRALVSLIPFAGELINSTAPSIYKLHKQKAFIEYMSALNASIQSDSFSNEDRERFSEKLQNFEEYSRLKQGNKEHKTGQRSLN